MHKEGEIDHYVCNRRLLNALRCITGAGLHSYCRFLQHLIFHLPFSIFNFLFRKHFFHIILQRISIQEFLQMRFFGNECINTFEQCFMISRFRIDVGDRIQKSGRSDDLFDYVVGKIEFVLRRCSGQENRFCIQMLFHFYACGLSDSLLQIFVRISKFANSSLFIVHFSFVAFSPKLSL